MPGKKRRRRKYLVNRPIQLGLVFFLLWMLGVTVFLTWLLTYYFTWDVIIRNLTPGADLQAIVNESGRYVLLALLPAFAVVLFLSAWIHLYLSNRIAGPLYRLERVFAEMARGNWPEKVETRHHDYLKELSKTVNDLIRARREEKEEITARLEEILQQAENIGRRDPALQVKIRPLVMLLERAAAGEKAKADNSARADRPPAERTSGQGPQAPR